MRSRARTLIAAVALATATGTVAPAAAVPSVGGPAGTSTAAADEATVLVGFEDGAGPALVHETAGLGEVVGVIDQIDVHVVAVAPGTVDAAIAVYERLPGVAFAEPNLELALHGEPDDPLLDEQYQLDHMRALEGFTAYNEAVDAEPYAPTGGATLAILDSGIDLSHPELGDKVVGCASYLTGTGTAVPDACQDNNFHGTYVAGIAAAIADNDEGMAGVAFDADLLVYQVCTALCLTADSAAAMVDAADDGAQVANYSFGGAAPSETGRLAVEYAHEAGVLQVSSSGNDGEQGHDTVTFPAAYDEVLSVGATDRDFERAEFSSFGPELDVVAPGVGILSTMPGGWYTEHGFTFSGTSFSGPAVAGLGGLLVGLGLDHEEARTAIIAAADPEAVGEIGRTDEFGHGMADVAATIDLALGSQDDGTRGGGNGVQGDPPGHDRRQGPPDGRGPGR